MVIARLVLVLGGCGGGSGGPDGSSDALPDVDGAGTDAVSADGGASDGGHDAETSDDAATDAATDAADGAPPRQDGCVADMDLGSATGVDVSLGSTEGGGRPGLSRVLATLGELPRGHLPMARAKRGHVGL